MFAGGMTRVKSLYNFPCNISGTMCLYPKCRKQTTATIVIYRIIQLYYTEYVPRIKIFKGILQKI